MKYETIFRRLHEAVINQLKGSPGLLTPDIFLGEVKTLQEEINNGRREGRDFRIFVTGYVEQFVCIELQDRVELRIWPGDWITRASGVLDLSGEQESVFIFRCQNLGGESLIRGNLYAHEAIPEARAPLEALAEEWRAELLAT